MWEEVPGGVPGKKILDKCQKELSEESRNEFLYEFEKHLLEESQKLLEGF